MEKQEKLFNLLKAEQVEYEFVPDLLLSQIIAPKDALDPSPELVEDIRWRGVIEPLLVQAIGTNRYAIVSGRRRYLAAIKAERETVSALITRISVAQRDVLCIKLNRLRAENLLADIEATERLLTKGLDDKQIGDLTGLKPQEIERRKRLAVANSVIRKLLREGRCSPSVAEAAAKLPPTQQAKLIEKFAGDDAQRLTMRDVSEIKEARSQNAIDALPRELFTRSFNLPTSSNAYYRGDGPHKWLNRFAGRLWETLLELERTGALDLKSNKQSRRACANARQFLAEIKEDVGFVDNAGLYEVM
jgi:ParB/RepB/Spo0J family partition protein